MSNSMRAMLGVLLVVLASVVLVRNGQRSTARSARATEMANAPAATTPTQNQLRQLLVERKRLLDGIVALEAKSLEYGRGDVSEYTQARKAALLAGIDLCETKEQRIEIRREVVQLYTEAEKSLQREAAAGQRPQTALDKMKVARIEAEIDLLREQLKR